MLAHKRRVLFSISDAVAGLVKSPHEARLAERLLSGQLACSSGVGSSASSGSASASSQFLRSLQRTYSALARQPPHRDSKGVSQCLQAVRLLACAIAGGFGGCRVAMASSTSHKHDQARGRSVMFCIAGRCWSVLLLEEVLFFRAAAQERLVSERQVL
jgi:hypothetical protein